MSSSLLAMLVAQLVQAANSGALQSSEIEQEYEIPPPFSTVAHASWAQLVHLWLEHGAPLLHSLPPRDCPTCGSPQARILFKSHDGYPYSECSDCGCWFVPRHVSPALYARFFEVCPDAKALADAGFEKRTSSANLAGDLARIGAYLDLLAPHLPAGERRYLDIGAGTGSSLLAARERGLRDALGVEAAPQAFDVATIRGVNMLDTTQGLPAGPFGLISLWETLEHLDDPSAVLQASRSRLARGGLLAVTVPNLDSPLTRIMRGDCSYVGGGSDGPGHISLFGPAQLKRLFARAGLTLLHLDGQYGSNYLELAGYLMGRHRGATDLLDQCPIRSHLPAPVMAFLNALGPQLVTVERSALATPILIAVACRQEDYNETEPVARALAAQRTEAIDQTIAALQDGIVDPQALVTSLRGEIAIRDRVLTGMESELQILRSRHPLARLAYSALRRTFGDTRGQ